MELGHILKIDKRKKAACLLVFAYKTGKNIELALQDKALSKMLKAILKKSDFQAKVGQTFLQIHKELIEQKVLFVGLGEKNELADDKARGAAAKAIRSCMSHGLLTLNVALPHIKISDRAILEGLIFSNYFFTKKTKDVPIQLIKAMHVHSRSKKSLLLAENLLTLSDAVFFARDLVNESAYIVTADHLSKVAKDLGKLPNVKTTVLDKKRIEKEKMGLLLAVNQGSKGDPAMIIVEYLGDKRTKDRTVLIGKGITYDTGGLCLKPASGMETMRTDMSGAACVLGTIKAAAALKIKRNVIAVVPTTDNAIGSNSYRPGDIYTSHSGKTVEVINTDAEGRLVLADALSYAQKHLKPTRIIDVATLTGGAVVALGENIAACFTDDEKLQKQLVKASKVTDEKIWPLPLFQDYREILKSEVADIKNSGVRWGSAITAALFLKDFVEHKSWCHLDIAGPAFTNKEFGCNPKFATGFGIRLLIELLQTL